MKFESYQKYKTYFESLIQEERKAEMEFHQNEISLLSPKQREKKGRAILLLSGKDAGTGIGGTYLVKLVRASGLPDNELSVGDIAIVSKEKPSGQEPLATVVEKTKRSITIAYNSSPPYLLYQKNLRLDLYANDITFQRMLSSLDQVSNQSNSIKILLNKIDLFKDEVEQHNFDFINRDLNQSQKDAIKKAVNSNDLFIIHGPPGTGKTTTLSECIYQLSHLKNKVLVTAPSNTAVDNLLEKLTKSGLKCIRIGNPVRMNEAILSHSLDVLLQDSSDFQLANSLWNKTQILQKEQQDYLPATRQNTRGLKDDAIIRQAKSKKPYRGIPHSKLRKMAKWISLQREINALYEEANQLQQKAIHALLDEASVVCTTNSTAGSELLKDFTFDVVCVDEATQSTEPETLIPLIKGKKWILAGDHKQLPPTVKSEKATPLKVSLFERLMYQNDEGLNHMLSIQYRMHQQIMSFSNKQFYANELRAHPSIARHTLKDLSGYSAFNMNPFIPKAVSDPDRPIVFMDCADGVESSLEDSFSYYNEAEISLVQQVADELLSSKLFPEDIGIISPYDQQVSRLKSKLRDYHIEIKSIDGFQGREKEVIIISLVRANNNGKIGFLKDYRRLNVALTRAKRKLVIIGHKETLMHDKLYAEMIELFENNSHVD